MNSPFLLVRATTGFARVGYSVFVRVFGRHAKAAFWGALAVSTIVVVVLQLKGV